MDEREPDAAPAPEPGGPAHALRRWRAAHGARQVVFVGDSITRAFGRPEEATPSWVELVAMGLGCPDGVVAEGFRGLWNQDEWARTGTWTQIQPTDPADVAPFGQGFSSSGTEIDELRWTKAPGATVGGFALYWAAVPGLGDWQYAIDDGPWHNVGAPPAAPNDRLLRLFVDAPVDRAVTIHGFDGSAPCIASFVGIDAYTPHRSSSGGSTRRLRGGTRVHHLGVGMQFLGHFCRPSAGEPLALLDDLEPQLIVVAFSNDALWDDAPAFGATLEAFVKRVARYADVLLISPYEQRPPRRVHDAVTATGSPIVTSDTVSFVASDVTAVATGTNLPDLPPAAIRSVQSPTSATLSVRATGDCIAGELVVGQGREAEVQASYRAATRRAASATGCAHLDIYDAWSSIGAAGWEAARDKGLMQDRYHASPLGHRDIADRLLGLLGAQSQIGS